MKAAIIVSALPLLASALAPHAEELATRYAVERKLRVHSETRLDLELVSFEMERDGEPVEGRDPVGQRSSEARTVTYVDHLLDAPDGVPLRLRRTFETVEAKGIAAMGDEEREIERECPLDGVTLELTSDGEKVTAVVVEGEEPQNEDLLQGHRMTLALDALLPEGEIEVDGEWELDDEAIKTALGIADEPRHFPRPEAAGGGEEGGGRGRRGFSGMRQGPASLMRDGEWSGTAKVVALREEGEHGIVARIALELRTSGELPEPEFGGGRGPRGERSLAAPGAPAALAGSFEIELEGELLFAHDLSLPVALTLAGTASMTQNREFSRGETTMRMSSEQRGDVALRVRVEEANDE